MDLDTNFLEPNRTHSQADNVMAGIDLDLISKLIILWLNMHFIRLQNTGTDRDLNSFAIAKLNSDSSYSPTEIHDEALNNSLTEQDGSVTSDDDMTGPEPTSTIPVNSLPECSMAHHSTAAVPLFHDSQLTRSSSHLLITKFAARHSLSDVALKDLLRLIKLHCPPSNNCYRTLYEFHKDSDYTKKNITLHYYCTKCTQEVKDLNEEICYTCQSELKVKGSVSSFLEISVESQLQSLFSRM